MYNRLAYFILGCLFTVLALLMLATAIIVQQAPLAITYTFLSLSIMSFCLYYLFPHFVKKDERVKIIKQKGAYFSIFAFLLYVMIFSLLLQTNLLQLSASYLIAILASLMISTIFISFCIFAKLY
ncbi:permease [Gracilibacillus salinarum]|uniref:Permease n=1 Tax=Gracilibacillus salinarum TaxID=2932255 RepID=A0ABY4GKU4_9BACI|nr:permease [Gracilibacillus salinarum]UOQ84849.1 permease [Gracilibacillus salinarum]